MALIEINKDPSGKDLFVFALALATLGTVASLMATYRFEAPDVGRGIGMGFGILLTVYGLVPPVRRPVFLGWSYLTSPIGWIIGTGLMCVVYYGVVMPVGLTLRFLGRDPLTKGPVSGMTTYWIERPEPPGPDRYFKQF
jgi:hypothetical protein